MVETSDPNNVFNYQMCEESVEVVGVGCATFRLMSYGSGSNNQCGAFDIMIELCSGLPSASVIGSQGTCTGYLRTLTFKITRSKTAILKTHYFSN